MTLNLADTVTNSAERHPENVALRLGDAAMTYAELDEASARLATLLRERGVEQGDRVAIMLPNVPEFPIAYYGILRAGGLVVPMNVLLKEREIRFFLEDSGARLILAWHEFLDEARAGAEIASSDLLEVEPAAFGEAIAAHEPAAGLADTDESDTAVILYTSGTTGTPKGAELTHLNLSLNAALVAETLTEVGPDDVVLGALPQFHSFGQTATLNASLRAGACVVMLPRFDAGEALEAMQRERVTVFQGVPTMYGAMLNHPGRDGFDTSSLAKCMSGGASMPVEVMRAFEDAIGCVILEGYGLSETSPVACSNHPDRERKPGSIGQPVRGVEMAIVDEDDNELPAGEPGEVVIRGHNIMKGYWKRPDATEEAIRNGWFHSGDIGRTDEDGYFYIVDRKKDLIIRGGYNVFPREVEEVLYEHPAVLEAAVVGAPDEEMGEEVCAAVVLRPGVEASADDLQQHVKSQLAAYKYPRRIWFLDELPKGPTGKILKREISPP
jgi:long-chain acyl-CoA synthetase